ncbi:hypothetical protein MMC11_006231 [Xylographa trunciseda]|nr:hypothetical protein [Xylographa trunciseda]
MSNKNTSQNHVVRASKNRPIPIIDPNTRPSIIGEGSVAILSQTGDAQLGARTKKSTSYRLQELTSSSTTPPETVITHGHSQPTKNISQAWKANVYAQPYIPLALSAINLSHATIVPSAPLSSIDFHDYVSSFAGRRYLMPHIPLEILNPANLPSQPALLLDTRIYESFFVRALTSELEAEATTTSSYNLYQVPLQHKNPQEPIYELRVPGLREDRPRLDLGDTVELRQLRIDVSTGRPYGMEQWLVPGGGNDRGYSAPGFTGMQYNATVWGLDRNKEQLLLRIDGCVDEGLIFNVIFRVQRRRVEPFQRAIADAGDQLCLKNAEQLDLATSEGKGKNRTDYIGGHVPSKPEYDLSGELFGDENKIKEFSMQSTWMRRMLFPDETDGVNQQGLPKGVFTQKFYDENLNYEQQASIRFSFSLSKAVASTLRITEPATGYFTRIPLQKAIDSIQHQNYGTVPFLISGPPGTGKTKTIVETALQLIYHTHPGRKNILLCAPSDPAADILALRVKPHVPYEDLFRLNSSSRSFAEVPGELLPYCHTTDNLFSLPEFPKLMAYRIVVTTCRDAGILVQARVTNRDLFSLESGITTALYPGSQIDNSKIPLHWNALLIDEAAQATEPEACVPLTVVTPPSTHNTNSVLVVMAGDQCQLGPRIFSPDSPLETSLFERLFSRPLYSAHPLSRRHLARHPQSNPPIPTIRPPFATLFKNYRSHRAILAVPSALFYHDTLTAYAAPAPALASWPGWRGRRWPVLFVSNPSPDERTPHAHGWYNAGEAALACALAASFAAHGVPQRDICIMSPFRAQVQRLRHTLRAATPAPLRDVSVGPTEAFQGLESRVVILCTTRARARFLPEDAAQRAGVVGEPKRLNVALTRAREGLVVLGNAELLCADERWRVFVAFCRRHGLWEGEGGVGDGEATPAYVSSLERGLVWKERVDGEGGGGRGGGMREEEAMWVSGHAAEEALREE